MSDFVASGAKIEFDKDSGKPALFGDFYLEMDDVTKGVTLLPRIDAEKDSRKCKDKLPPWEGCVKEERLFNSDDIAPALSKDIAEYLSLTTAQLFDDAPVAVANKLISFFESVVISQINKVNRRRFTIRAEVIVSGMHCETKVHIYQDSPACVVEFQKLAGDAIAFNKMFSLAKEYLQCPGMIQVDANTQLDVPIVVSPPDQTLTPLFNMIEHSHDVDVLAEAASSLAEAVKNPMIAEQMRMPCALSALRELRQVNDFRVAYPTSQLLTWCPWI